MNAMKRAVKAGDKKYIITCKVYDELKRGVINKKQAWLTLANNNIGCNVLELWLKDLKVSKFKLTG